MLYAPILAEKDKIAIDAQNRNFRFAGVLDENVKSVFLKSGSIVFSEILDLSSREIPEKNICKRQNACKFFLSRLRL